MKKSERRYINGMAVIQYLLFTVVSIYIGYATVSFCGVYQEMELKTSQFSGLENSVDRIANSFELYNEKRGYTQ